MPSACPGTGPSGRMRYVNIEASVSSDGSDCCANTGRRKRKKIGIIRNRLIISNLKVSFRQELEDFQDLHVHHEKSCKSCLLITSPNERPNRSEQLRLLDRLRHVLLVTGAE